MTPQGGAYLNWHHPATDGWEFWDWYWGRPMPDSSEPDISATPQQIAEWAAAYINDGWRPLTSSQVAAL